MNAALYEMVPSQRSGSKLDFRRSLRRLTLITKGKELVRRKTEGAREDLHILPRRRATPDARRG